MKNLIAAFLVLGLFSLNACIVNIDDDFDGPPCEYNFTGTVCFINYTDRDIQIRTGDLRIDVWAYADQCVEVSDGYYEFVGKSGFKRWDGSFDVFACETSNVYLDY